MNINLIDKINNDLEKFTDIVDKLNYWRTHYLDKYSSEELKIHFELKTKEELGSSHGDGLSGDLKLPFSDLENKCMIPPLDNFTLYAPLDQRIKYHSWLLYYKAEILFENEKKAIEDDLKKPNRLVVLEGKLYQLTQIINNAMLRLKKGEIDVSDLRSLDREKLYLWYHLDYYSESENWTGSSLNHEHSVKDFHFMVPYLKGIISNHKLNTIEAIKLSGISIDKLLDDLEQRRYFEKDDRGSLLNWFNGSILEKKINLDLKMYEFVTLIFNLKDGKYIKNGKGKIASSIANSFLFENEVVKRDSVSNVLRDGSTKRISPTDKVRFIDIDKYKTI